MNFSMLSPCPSVEHTVGQVTIETMLMVLLTISIEPLRSLLDGNFYFVELQPFPT